MIDAERMLGSLVRNAMSGGRSRRGRRRGRRGSMMSRSAKGGLALGALGVAIGVFEHWSKQQAGATSGLGSGGTASLPPLPSSPADNVALPPLPTADSSSTPGPPLPSSPPPSSADQDEALLLVRAMIAAANADHEVDDVERARIVRSLEESGLGEEERRFVLAEIESPMDVAALAAHATSPELADQIYVASLLAIEVDTRAEENYLARLAARLGLDETSVKKLERLLDETDGPRP